VLGVGDRREQVLGAFSPVQLLQEVVGLAAERVEFPSTRTGDVVVEPFVEVRDEFVPDVVGEHRQRVGLDRALVPVVLVLDRAVAVGDASIGLAGAGDVPLDGVSAARVRLRVLAQAVDETPASVRTSWSPSALRARLSSRPCRGPPLSIGGRRRSR